MTWFQCFIMFSLLWWLVFFCLLPIGVKTAHEAGEELVSGQEHGAPVKANLRKKAFWATLIGAALALSCKVTMDYFDFVIPL